MRETERNQFVGFMVFGLITAVLLGTVAKLGDDPAFTSAVSGLVPWIGSRLVTVKWIVIGLILVCGIMFPYISMMRDDERLEILGFAASKIIAALFIPALCFAAGAAWYGLQH